MKKKYAYFSFIILVLLTMFAIIGTYAWVKTSSRVNINSELVLSSTDALNVSLNGGLSYSSNVSLTDPTVSMYANDILDMELKDLTGDGINLYSPVIDPYTRLPKSTGWKKIRTDTGDDVMSLANDNENKTYLSFEVYFQSNRALDIYLSRTSFVLPSESGKIAGQVLFLKRTAAYKPIVGEAFDQSKVIYTYVTDENLTPFTVDDISELPTVFNQSVYCSEFDNTIDTAVFTSPSSIPDADGYIRSTQVLYSSNYVCSCIRVAFIDESKTMDYKDAVDDADGHLDLTDSKLRLVWAPNPFVQGKDVYDSVNNSHAYSLDLVTEETTERVDQFNNRIKDNKYYICPNNSVLVGEQKTFDDDIFVDILNDGEDTISIYENASSETRATLEKPHNLIELTLQENGMYEGKLRVVLWIEGTDPDAIVALTSGNSSGKGGGAGLIKFGLSFFGVDK